MPQLNIYPIAIVYHKTYFCFLSCYVPSINILTISFIGISNFSLQTDVHTYIPFNIFEIYKLKQVK